MSTIFLNPINFNESDGISESNDTIFTAIDTNLSSTNPGTFIATGTIGNNPFLSSDLDVDFFEVQLNAGDRFTIDIDANEFGASLDSVLRLFDSTGNELAVSDDTPAPEENFSLDSFIDFTASTTDTYYIGVSGFSNFVYNPLTQGSGTFASTGDYTIEINLIGNDELLNSGFETGDFTDWNTIGDVRVETANFGVNPTEGTFQALLTTNFGAVTDTQLESFIGLNTGDLDNLGNGNATEGSVIQLNSVTVQSGDVLSFDWNFLTSEGTPSFFNDFGFVSISSTSVSELADTNNIFTFSNTIFSSETGYNTFNYEFDTAGTYTINFGVVDVGDTSIDSALLVDNLEIISPLLGTFDDDVLIDTEGFNFISALEGDDVIVALDGNDQILAGEGNDYINAGEGNDLIEAGFGDDLIFGELGDDTINGDNGLDDIFGGDGNDLIDGGAGRDRLFGELGNDTINGGNGNDIIDGGEGFDVLSGGENNDRIRGEFGDDSLFGNNGSDRLIGNNGNDLLDGGNGNDHLTGVDTLIGLGTGEVDTLTGGLGSDTFILGNQSSVFYDDGNSFSNGESDFALITDFNPEQDFIQLHSSAEFYNLDFFQSSLGTIDAAIIYDSGILDRGEVIGIIENASLNLSITDSAFTFV